MSTDPGVYAEAPAAVRGPRLGPSPVRAPPPHHERGRHKALQAPGGRPRRELQVGLTTVQRCASDRALGCVMFFFTSSEDLLGQ